MVLLTSKSDNKLIIDLKNSSQAEITEIAHLLFAAAQACTDPNRPKMTVKKKSAEKSIRS